MRLIHSLLITAIVLLAGCTKSLTLIARDDGARWVGTAPTAHGGSGPMSIRVGERNYSGRWYYAESGTAGVIMPFAGSGSIGTVAGAAASPGVIHATAPKGGRLRCSFTYSSWSSTGFGTCEDENGAIYDLVIE